MKGNKGITLIALVITIIVLLILAAVSIAMLTGENSILKRASQSSAENRIGAANDAVSLFVTDKIAEFYEEAYANGNNTTLSAGLNSYLSTVVKEDALTAAIGDSEVTVKDVKMGSGLGNASQAGSIVLEAKDNSYNYTSTGTVNNGKITWKITKADRKN